MKKIMLRILVQVVASEINIEIDEYLKKCTCIKSITGDLVTTSDETVHVPETVLI